MKIVGIFVIKRSSYFELIWLWLVGCMALWKQQERSIVQCVVQIVAVTEATHTNRVKCEASYYCVLPAWERQFVFLYQTTSHMSPHYVTSQIWQHIIPATHLTLAYVPSGQTHLHMYHQIHPQMYHQIQSPMKKSETITKAWHVDPAKCCIKSSCFSVLRNVFDFLPPEGAMR